MKKQIDKIPDLNLFYIDEIYYKYIDVVYFYTNIMSIFKEDDLIVHTHLRLQKDN